MTQVPSDKLRTCEFGVLSINVRGGGARQKEQIHFTTLGNPMRLSAKKKWRNKLLQKSIDLCGNDDTKLPVRILRAASVRYIYKGLRGVEVEDALISETKSNRWE